ncbi:hypothetical protein Cob_v013183 [Colletotrichum orbiculare MAFF 240422]|uniref:Uncharacterized protein n=1 Tax=Colletotrichum orbiculare (strain 104-T / ATCC 96160 / CBS 514.97 / LARS 414 / MAFF 240422) TaxID=1213857 RepID=A0A484F7D7_COLOR|nr:hypothetical protein Cob_v013183 [Colletotrichum orbiculare MAFF 240422]
MLEVKEDHPDATVPKVPPKFGSLLRKLTVYLFLADHVLVQILPSLAKNDSRGLYLDTGPGQTLGSSGSVSYHLFR